MARALARATEINYLYLVFTFVSGYGPKPYIALWILLAAPVTSTDPFECSRAT